MSLSCPRRSAPLRTGGSGEQRRCADPSSKPPPIPGRDPAATTTLRCRLSRDSSRAAPPSSLLSPSPPPRAAPLPPELGNQGRGEAVQGGAPHTEAPQADLLRRSPARDRRRIFPGTLRRQAEIYCARAGALVGRHTWVGKSSSRTRAVVPAGCGELGVVYHCQGALSLAWRHSRGFSSPAQLRAGREDGFGDGVVAGGQLLIQLCSVRGVWMFASRPLPHLQDHSDR